ncbi:MAG: hypothetical protein WDN46_23205 [Methylocella sp.]
MKKLITARKALTDNGWLGTVLGGDSFAVMRVLLIAAMGEKLTASELAIYTEVTKRLEAPAAPVEECHVIAGRRSGKTLGTAAIAAYIAACCDHRDALGLGERGVLPILAASMQQAQTLMNFARGIFTDIPRFAAMAGSITADTISLKNRVDIQIRPASFRTIRGFSAVAVIAEEASMWQSDDSRNPDKEILAAVKPSLATTGGQLFCIGSPHARRGEMWRTYQKHFGPNGNPAILVANGPTKLFNPTIKQSVIDRAYEDDASVAASEWGGLFRNDLESYVSPEIVDACTVKGVAQIEFAKGRSYVAHVDPSGGGQDSFTLAIGHVEDNVGVLDLLLEKRPPFSPEEVVIELCEALKTYELHEVTGDRYGAGFTVELFGKNGVTYRHSEMTTSDYFGGFLPILNSRRVQLLDHRRLAAQLCGLERRASRVGAKDSIGHPPGGHDDLAASVAGLMARIVGNDNWSELWGKFDKALGGDSPLPGREDLDEDTRAALQARAARLRAQHTFIG